MGWLARIDIAIRLITSFVSALCAYSLHTSTIGIKSLKFITNNVYRCERTDGSVKYYKLYIDYYNYENAYYVDICTGLYDSICGVAYQITLPSSMITKDNLAYPESFSPPHIQLEIRVRI